MQSDTFGMKTTAQMHEWIHDFSQKKESKLLGTEKWRILEDSKGSYPCACQDQDLSNQKG